MGLKEIELNFRKNLQQNYAKMEGTSSGGNIPPVSRGRLVEAGQPWSRDQPYDLRPYCQDSEWRGAVGVGWAGPEAGSRQGSHVWPGPGSRSHGSSPPSKGSWASAKRPSWGSGPSDRRPGLGDRKLRAQGRKGPPVGPRSLPPPKVASGSCAPRPWG